jgi:tetratricopeptide (TPR) repeat protein
MSKKKKIFVFTIFCCLFLSQAIAGFNLQEAAPLLLNAPVSRDYKNGAKHVFSVSARENEVIEITCERKGIDIALAAFAPNGEKISVSNAPSGFAGFDRLVFVAEKAGEYRIELDSRRPGTIGGSYTILLKDERAAGETDLKRAEAMKLLGTAREILVGAENRLEKSAQAVEKLQKALALFEKTDDFQGQATTLFHLAYINGNEFGAKTKALELYEKALNIWSKTDDEAGKAICLTYLADEMRDFDSLENPRAYYVEKSQGYFDEALSLHRKLNDKLDEAAALTSLCRMYNDTQNFQKGFEACRESLRLEEDKNPLTNYRTYTNIASLYSNSGDLENALKYNRIALERYEIIKDYENPYRLAFIKSNVGGILANQKKYAEAEQNLGDALTITEEVKRTLYSGYIRVRLGLIYFETKRFAEALKVTKTAVENYREIDPVKIQAALNVLGKTYSELGQVDDARRLFAEAIEINRQNKDR